MYASVLSDLLYIGLVGTYDADRGVLSSSVGGRGYAGDWDLG
jgi:hypothetical protein